MRHILLGLGLAALTIGPDAQAQQAPPCSNGQLTQSWLSAWSRNDQQGLQFMAGNWSSQVQDPATGQVVYQMQSFQANGIYDYHNRVCSSTGCNDYQGTGLYAIQQQGGGAIMVFLNFSDAQRRNFCVGSMMRIIDNATIQGSDGSVARRVQ